MEGHPQVNAVELRGIGKVYPGQDLSLRGTKLELKGPVLWLQSLLPSLRARSEAAGSVTALGGVDLEVRAGEILALIGHNGSGKTTLVKILAGLLPSTTGEGSVMGVPCCAPGAGETAARGEIGTLLSSLAPLRRMRIAVSHQGFAQLAIPQLPGVERWQVDPIGVGKFTIERFSHDVRRTTPALLGWLRSAGLQLHSMETERTCLGDLYQAHEG